MKFLVYAILRADAGLPPLSLEGEGGPVTLLVEEGLAAAVSPANQTPAPASPARWAAYARVIEEIFRFRTLLPMRYGSLLEEAQIRDLLKHRRLAWQESLAELEGQVELGVRLLLTGANLQTTVAEKSSKGRRTRGVSPLLNHLNHQQGADAPRSPNDAPRSPNGSEGVAYLAQRKSRYDREDGLRLQAEEGSEGLQRACAGLFTRCREEMARNRQVLLRSLHFLVPRANLKLFREAVLRFQETTPARVLLTGPWPPYNFVPSIGSWS